MERETKQLKRRRKRKNKSVREKGGMNLISKLENSSIF